MAKRKRKKILLFSRIIINSIISILFIFLNIILFFWSFKLLNLNNFNIDNVIYIFIISLCIGILTGVFIAINNKKATKYLKRIKGFLVSIPIIAIVLFIFSLGYNHLRITSIKEELELKFEEYDYFIDFDDIEYGYNYRIDENDYLYYIDGFELKSVKPTSIKKLKKDYKLDVYILNRGYVIINNDKAYYTRYNISENSNIYKINLPIDIITKEYKMKEYYYLKGNDFNYINEDYASQQDGEKLYLFKRYKGNIYTKEKLYDLRIQVKNNFENYYEAIYAKDYIRIDIDGKKQNIKFTFNDNLDVIYSKEGE